VLHYIMHSFLVECVCVMFLTDAARFSRLLSQWIFTTSLFLVAPLVCFGKCLRPLLFPCCQMELPVRPAVCSCTNNVPSHSAFLIWQGSHLRMKDVTLKCPTYYITARLVHSPSRYSLYICCTVRWCSFGLFNNETDSLSNHAISSCY